MFIKLNNLFTPIQKIFAENMKEASTKISTKETKLRYPGRVREHLANERTYLSWMRGAISLVGFGLITVRLQLFQSPVYGSEITWELGLILSLVGLITVLLSSLHFFAVRRDIDADFYQPAGRWVILSSMAVTFLGTGVVYYVFTASF
ncbi:YidH family protein [[Phormidium ambiguum] IAM M-71]|nr:DUF202 domain-containing protein [Phormidium ambiguum]